MIQTPLQHRTSKPGGSFRWRREVRRSRVAGSTRIGCRLLVLGLLGIPVACDESPSTVTPPPITDTVANEATLRRGYETPIPSVEYWEDSTTPKYYYEMRFDPPASPGAQPRLHRNGWARAYYRNGTLEREGAYRYNSTSEQSERVGTWTYYTQGGDVLRVEERGGPVVWTSSDQIIAVPGTEDR